MPARSRLRSPRVATPALAATVVWPDRVAPPGFAPSTTVTVPVKPVATLPWASCAVTWTAGVIAAPAAVLLGWTVNTRRAAMPGVTLNAALVAVVSPAAAAVSV